MWIVESIGKWGVKATNSGTRLFTPKAGDVIDFGEDYENNPYPFNKTRYGRIEQVGKPARDGYCGWLEEGQAHVCVHPGSAFLREDGSVSISGGPFAVIETKDLKPTVTLKALGFWNWGNNSPGADQGIDYQIARPVFKYEPEED